MSSVGIFEAKNRLSELVERVQRGEEITLTRRGEVVARIVPPAHPANAQALDEVMNRIRTLRKGVRAGRTPLRKLIEDGRR